MMVLNHKLMLLAVLVLALFLNAESVDAKKQCRAKKHSKQQASQQQSTSSASASSSSNGQAQTSASGNGSASASSSGSSGSSSSNTQSGNGGSVTSSSSSNATASSSSISVSGVTPPLGKAGVAGGNSLPWTASALGWYYDWTPNPDNPNRGDILAVPMLWGLGRVDHDDDAERFAAFKNVKPGSSPFVMGFNEPDFSGVGSSGVIPVADAAAAWDEYIGPWGDAGSKLISPSMAMQNLETWLGPFLKQVKHQPDVIAVHIFQNDMDMVKTVVNHFAQYGKPMWITEFACINYSGPSPVYCDQGQTDSMLGQMVDYFESDPRIAAYAVSDASNGPYGDLTPNQDGQSLSATGSSYLASVKSASGKRRRRGLIPVRK